MYLNRLLFQWQLSESLLKSASPSGNEMLLDGRAPKPGEIMKFPTLARTFLEVANKGKDGFYRGRVAEAIVNLVQSKGGVLELSDLAEHNSTFVDPIKYTYSDSVTVYEVLYFLSLLPVPMTQWSPVQCPPNGQGQNLGSSPPSI